MLMKVQAVKEMGIADVARDTGLTRRAIRFYEGKGLVDPDRLPGSKHGGVRIYSPADLDRLHAIKLATEMGFSLLQIGNMIDDGEIVGRQVKPGRMDRLEAIEVQKRQIEKAQAAIKLLESA